MNNFDEKLEIMKNKYKMKYLKKKKAIGEN